MEQNLNSEKTPARASQAATSRVGNDQDSAGAEHKKMEDSADKAARRAGNRFREDETVVPGSTEFTK